MNVDEVLYEPKTGPKKKEKTTLEGLRGSLSQEAVAKAIGYVGKHESPQQETQEKGPVCSPFGIYESNRIKRNKTICNHLKLQNPTDMG